MIFFRFNNQTARAESGRRADSLPEENIPFSLFEKCGLFSAFEASNKVLKATAGSSLLQKSEHLKRKKKKILLRFSIETATAEQFGRPGPADCLPEENLSFLFEK